MVAAGCTVAAAAVAAEQHQEEAAKGVAGPAVPVAARWDSGTGGPLCQRVPSAARPPNTIGFPTAHLPEGTGECCPDELSTDVCDLSFLSHEGLGTMFWRLAAWSYATKLHDGEMRGERTSAKNNKAISGHSSQ